MMKMIGAARGRVDIMLPGSWRNAAAIHALRETFDN